MSHRIHAKGNRKKNQPELTEIKRFFLMHPHPRMDNMIVVAETYEPLQKKTKPKSPRFEYREVVKLEKIWPSNHKRVKYVGLQ